MVRLRIGALIGFALCLQTVYAQEYYYESRQVSSNHRFDLGHMTGAWGHHLGHLVRTATQGLWYVDDTGTDVNVDPALQYLHLDGSRWVLVTSLANPSTIQQNTASLALGDTIYSYGVNVSGGYIEEAVYNTRTRTGAYNRRIRFIGGGTNYIGAALSPNGTRVVWWTRVVNNNGPSDWVYMYNDGTGWSPSIVSTIPGNDFSYAFASFLNDSVFYIGGEIPRGGAPNWTFNLAAGMVRLGYPIEGLTVMKGDNYGAQDIWVNRASGDVHLFGYGSYGSIGYFFKPAGGSWNDTLKTIDIGGVGRSRIIEGTDGNLYFILSQGGFKMMVIPTAGIVGRIDFSGVPLIPLNYDEGFTSSYAIFPERGTFQTTPVQGVNFAFPGNDYDYANLVRHVAVHQNDGSMLLNLSLPNGNEVFPGDVSRRISWYRKPGTGIDSVHIEWSSDGGNAWSAISASSPNTGSYLWKVPKVSSDQCLVRVSDARGSGPSDQSDAVFSITYTPPVYLQPTAQILNPTKDTTLLAGSTITLRGSGTDPDGYIVNYQWATGDGRTVKGIVRSFDHTYQTVGVYYCTLQVQDNDNQQSVPDSVKITVLPNTSVEDDGILPPSFGLWSAYPNPFNAQVTIRYSLEKKTPVALRVFSIQGMEVSELVNQTQDPGTYTVTWDGILRDHLPAPSGVYFVRLETPAGVRIGKCVMIR